MESFLGNNFSLGKLYVWMIRKVGYSFREHGLVVLHMGSFQCPLPAGAVSGIFGEGGLFLTISVHVGQCKRSILPSIFPTCLLKVIPSLSSELGNWSSAMVSAQGSRAGVKF